MSSKYTIGQNSIHFNPSPPEIMHIDLNSCFATIEQQANPFLRGKPIAVAAYTTPSGCIIAPSVEAKKLGIKVGMRVKDGISIYPELMVLPPDPWKYRNVHLRLKKLLETYSSKVLPKSIDEFVVDFKNAPLRGSPLKGVAREIKRRIKEDIGDWITVSVGFGPNRFLAKLASGLHKPDGLDLIDKTSFACIYKNLKLTDLCGIKLRNAIRLNGLGIFDVWDFYQSPYWKIKAAFQSILGYYWYLRLRGWEIDDFSGARKSYGNSYALPKPSKTLEELSPILSKLVEKMSFRLRRAGYAARGVHLALSYRNGAFWHKGEVVERSVFDSREIYKKTIKLLAISPIGNPVRNVAVSVFDLKKRDVLQLDLFENMIKKSDLSDALDQVNVRWGNYVITSARMALADKGAAPDRIAFGGIKELEEFTIQDTTILYK